MFASTMEASTKKTLGTLAVVAAVGGGFLLITKGKKLFAGAKMNFALLGFRIVKLDKQEVQFAVKLRCYNPTKSPITIAINQVVAKYKDSPIAYSIPDIKGLTIESGQFQEPEIIFQVPYLNLLGKGLNLSTLSNVGQLKADMTFTMTISVNGETITTTQSISEEQNMSGLALGELGIVSGPRNTKDGSRFNHLIQKATGKEVFVKNGNVIDTVDNCIDIISSHYLEVRDLAKTLNGDSLKQTCRNIFDFSYSYLQYHKDDDGTEQLRTPARSWLDGQVNYKQKGKQSSGIDCDDYSIFVGSLLKCLGIRFKLRITKYDGKQNFQHIYVIVPDRDDAKGEIVIDPVLSKFNYQKAYSFEKSDFDMSPVELAGLRGVNGFTGTSALGLPISVLSGIDLAGGSQVRSDHEDLMGIISGVDFDDAISGSEDSADATYRYLVRTRDFLLKNQQNKDRMAQVQNPDQFILMLDQAIKFWNTPQRDQVLEQLAKIEEKLADNGLIKCDTDAIDGFDEYEIEGLGKARKGKGRFFKAIKNAGKKAGNGGKKAVKAVVRFNPLSISIRNGLLAGLRLNLFGISKKLQYAYLPEELVSKYKLDPVKYAELKKTHSKVLKLFKGLQGKEENLKKAILKGAKQKSSDFTQKGMEGLISDLKTLESVGDLSEIGNLGVVATGATVVAASGVLAKIANWLKPIKDIFQKSKEVIKAQVDTIQPGMIQNQQTVIPSSANQTSTYMPINNAGSNSNNNSGASKKKKLSKGAKIGIGIGALALLGTGTYFLVTREDEKKQSKKSTQKKSPKKSLGSIELQ